jgi:8-oxo-dGTP diphosphatase
MENKFNIRVYGLLINHNQEILLSDEEINGKRFTKFPGGGLEFGEGLLDGLKREFMEECNMEIEINRHFYTTDFYVQSIFGGGQLIAVYYLVKPKNKFELKTSKISYDFIQQTSNSKQAFRFISIKAITEAELTFPVDKHIVALLKQNLF